MRAVGVAAVPAASRASARRRRHRRSTTTAALQGVILAALIGLGQLAHWADYLIDLP